jgi:PAS domain S-box-containing protein
MRLAHVLFLLVLLPATLHVAGLAAQEPSVPGLTVEERAFLTAHPTLRVRDSADLPPFLMPGPDGPQGMTRDYVRLVAAKLGLKVIASDVVSFTDVLKRLPTGDGIDVQPVIRPTPDREASILFTRPYLNFPMVIVTRDNEDFVGSLEDLHGRKVAVEKSYWYTAELQKRHPDITLKRVDGSSQAIEAVAVGEADAYVGILAVAVWQMDTKGYANLKIAAPANLSAGELGMGVRGDWPLMASALDKALAAITPEEHRDIRRRWLPIRTEVGIDPKRVLLWGGIAAAGALVFVGILALANRRLIKEVALRRRAETELRASDATARQLLNASTDACMLFDVDGTMCGFNDIFAKRLGADPDRIIGSSLWDYFPPASVAMRKKAVAGVVESGEPVVMVDVRNGIHLSNHIYPIRDPDGQVVRLAVYSRDITDQVVAERRIKAYIDEIKRSNQELEQFAYIASHDLREPLRQIANFVALLERRYGQDLTDEAREYIRFAREGAKRLDGLMLDLLEYSRIGRGGEIGPVDTETAIARALENLDGLIKESGAAVVIQPHPPQVAGSETHLVHLFQNLIGNALKYRSPDRVPKVSVTFDRDGEFVQFVVADNGIGIEPEYFDRIFGVFQRLHTNDEYEGSGIGLAICRRVIEQSGGRLWVESKPGEGSTFLFTLRAA